MVVNSTLNWYVKVKSWEDVVHDLGDERIETKWITASLWRNHEVVRVTKITMNPSIIANLRTDTIKHYFECFVGRKR